MAEIFNELSPDRLLDIEKRLSEKAREQMQIAADRLIDIQKSMTEQTSKVTELPSERTRELESLMLKKHREFQNALPTERASSLLSAYGAIKQFMDIPPSEVIENRMRVKEDVMGSESFALVRPYRPSAWGKVSGEQDLKSLSLVCMSEQLEDGRSVNYFFDAVLRTNHTTTRTITKHPIQTGAAVADHSYQMPAMVSMDIGMSDAMDSYSFSSNPNDFVYTTNGSKSVNAYRAFVDLQKKGVPLTLNTKLNRYSNMIISQITTDDDYTTAMALKCTITFEEVFITDVGVVEKSRFPQISEPMSKTNVPAKNPKNDINVSVSAQMAGRGEGSIGRKPISLGQTKVPEGTSLNFFQRGLLDSMGGIGVPLR